MANLLSSVLDRNRHWVCQPDNHPKIYFTVVNRGKTPGTVTDLKHRVINADVLAPDPGYDAIESARLEKTLLAEGDRGDVMTSVLRGELKAIEAGRIAYGQSTLWFYGRVCWIDVFNQPHSKGFLWKYSGDGFRPDYRPAYNRVT